MATGRRIGKRMVWNTTTAVFRWGCKVKRASDYNGSFYW
jgi:hypothetical protein